jgi:hypothetical protein
VVFGMPREAIRLGAAESVLPLDQIATHIQTSVKSAFRSGDDRDLKPHFFAQVKPQLST